MTDEAPPMGLKKYTPDKDIPSFLDGHKLRMRIDPTLEETIWDGDFIYYENNVIIRKAMRADAKNEDLEKAEAGKLGSIGIAMETCYMEDHKEIIVLQLPYGFFRMFLKSLNHDI